MGQFEGSSCSRSQQGLRETTIMPTIGLGANSCAAHARRITIQRKDMELARRLA